MSRVAYVNGRYLPRAHACVDIEDRGFQFADGVYEVCQVRDGLLIDEDRHLARLQRSLSELRIRMPMTETALRIVLRETIARNRVRDGIVYLQVTRGSARRDFPFPDHDVPPTLVVTARSANPDAMEHQAEQVAAHPFGNAVAIAKAALIQLNAMGFKTAPMYKGHIAIGMENFITLAQESFPDFTI